jgi:hypothetical protein
LEKWFRRELPRCSFIWKLEPQQKGPPHYHLFVWGITLLHHALLTRRWFAVVGSSEPAHLAAGTRVEAVRSRPGVMRSFTENHLQWVRALDWTKTRDCSPLDS